MIAFLATASVQAAQPPVAVTPSPPPPHVIPIPGPPAPPAPPSVRIDPPVPAEIPPPRVPARARVPLFRLFSSDDYPAYALRGGHEGRTAVLLQIAPNGFVAGCVVTSTSGSGSLDSAACRVLRARARFRPAEDGAGNPAWDTVRTAVNWVLPEPPPPPACGGAAPCKVPRSD